VHSGFSLGTPSARTGIIDITNVLVPQADLTVVTDFDVKVLGNPTTTSFKLKLESSDINKKITMKVVDINGRSVEIKETLRAGQLVEFGSRYKTGLYFVEVVQGEERKVIKLLKVN
jgi:hypothetical protein